MKLSHEIMINTESDTQIYGLRCVHCVRVCMLLCTCTHHNSPAHAISHLERKYVAIITECNYPLAGDLLALGIDTRLINEKKYMHVRKRMK